MKNIIALSIVALFFFAPSNVEAAGLLGGFYRGTVTDQGDCVNIDGKLMAIYRSPTSEGIPFIFETGKTRVMPRWVAPADGQTVFIFLGGKATCTKSNGTSREDRVARYYSVSGAQRAAQAVRQGVDQVLGGNTSAGSGGGSGIRPADIQRLYPPNNLPGITSPYNFPTSQPGFPTGGGGFPFGSSNYGGSNFGSPSQLIIQDNADVSGGVLIRLLER